MFGLIGCTSVFPKGSFSVKKNWDSLEYPVASIDFQRFPYIYIPMLKTAYILLLSFLLPVLCWAQPGVEWELVTNKSDYDRAYGLTSTPDGGYMVTGVTYNAEENHTQAALLKVDIRGNEVWSKAYGFSGKESFQDAVALPNGDVIALGRTTSKGAGGRDIWVVKVNEDGELLWDKTYGARYDDEANAIIATSDGGFLIAGQQMIKSSSNIDMWLIKLDANGEKEWDQLIGGSFRNRAAAAAETKDGYVIAGNIHPSSSEDYKGDMGRVIKVDKQGNVKWDKVIGGDKDDELHGLALATDGSIYVTGNSQSLSAGSDDVWLAKLDAKGNVKWEKNYGIIVAEKGNGIVATKDGFAVASVVSSRTTKSEDIEILHFDKEGELQWKEVLGGTLNETPNDITLTSDGGVLVASSICTHYGYNSEPVKCKMMLIKLRGNPTESVENYIARKMKSWEKRGEFEKSEVYAKRVSEESRKKVQEKHRREAIDHYASQLIDVDHAELSRYNPDAETFNITFHGMNPLPLAVPIDEAQAFKENWSDVQFEKARYGLRQDRFVLQGIMLVLNGNEYTFAGENAGWSFKKTGTREITEEEGTIFRGGGDPLAGLNVSDSKKMTAGKCYALIIGIDNYKGNWTPLNNAVRDAQALEILLKKKYKVDQFKTLYDEEATRGNIINSMLWLVENVKENDNVFIFYSGHGEYNKALKKGYWVPVDAQTASMSMYISNSDILTFLNGMKSKHTLLISDACFSGDIFRGNTVAVNFEESEKYYKEVYNLKSRQAITSGGIEPVMDGGRDGHSVFAYYLLKALNNNDKRLLDASQLFSKIKVPVVNNSSQTPKFQPIKNTGDEGGQFIFFRR